VSGVGFKSVVTDFFDQFLPREKRREEDEKGHVSVAGLNSIKLSL
jgi:hypothetical protein